MAQVTLRGNPVNLAGEMPKVGQTAPDFNLTGADMAPITKQSLAGKKKVLVVVPSVDTPVCQTETRKFNEQATSLGDNVAVVIASADLPFAMKRFCAAEGLNNVKTGSDVRDRDFGKRWGVAIADGPLQGITARAVFVIDENDKITYSELVPEIGQEPNYDAALAALKS
ncbi:MAG TPA: thiol peroxidase [Candidatus Limnocylindrales bacterium]|nr:thiol peroxidase [Candidatus Limnocylindrales bacterium]